MREVRWTDRGFNGGNGAGWILSQCGWFHGAHRAGADVDAVIDILRHRVASGETAFAELLATASASGWIFAAVGARFDVKDALKAHGYHWNGAESVWSREISSSGRESEEAWLAETVNAPRHRSKMDGPSIREVIWSTRHG